MDIKIGNRAVQYLIPSIISVGVLFLISTLLRTGESQSTTTIYVLSLFIAGGYFFISAVLLYLMKVLTAMVPSKKEKVVELKSELSYLKKLKKNVENRYYFKKDLDENTFRNELQEIARKEIEIGEKIAHLESLKKSKKKKGKKK